MDTTAVKMADEAVSEVTISGFLKSFRRWWGFYAILISLSLAAAITLCLVLPPKYKAFATLIPNQPKESKINRLEAIASRFGIDSPIPSTNFAEFLEPVVNSKSFLLRLADFPVDTGGVAIRLFDFYGPPGVSKDLDTLKFLSRMRSMVRFQKKTTGLVEVSVTAEYPQLAAGLANKATVMINEFAQEYNFANMRSHIQYLTGQLAGAEGERKKKNDYLVRFMETNRGIDPMTSPALFAKYTELKMDLEIGNQKYLLLRNQLETAELNQAKKESILMILDYASIPYFKTSPRRMLILFSFLVAGTVLAFLIHVGKEVLGMKLRNTKIER